MLSIFAAIVGGIVGLIVMLQFFKCLESDSY